MSSRKKGRGPTRGHKSAHLIQKCDGQMLSVLVPPTVGRPVGEFRSEFLTEVGVVVHDMAPLSIRQWSDITDA